MSRQMFISFQQPSLHNIVYEHHHYMNFYPSSINVHVCTQAWAYFPSKKVRISIVAAPSFSRWSRYRPSINDIVNYTHFRLSASWLLTNISLCVPAVRHNEQEMKKCRAAFSRVKWPRRTSIVDNWIPFFVGNIYAQLPVTTRAIAYKHIMCTLSPRLYSNVFLVCGCHEHHRGTFDRNFLVVFLLLPD